MKQQKKKRSRCKKSEQLGMPFGTASGRLKKLIFFDLARKCGMDVCFKCRNPIDTPADLTVEHKLVWLDVDTALFWDLDNIAFSHRKCNVVERPSGAQRRIKAPPGTSRCSKCDTIKPLDLFRKDPSRWNGVKHQCKECEAAYDRKRRGTLVGDSHIRKPKDYVCKMCKCNFKSKSVPERCASCLSPNWNGSREMTKFRRNNNE